MTVKGLAELKRIHDSHNAAKNLVVTKTDEKGNPVSFGHHTELGGTSAPHAEKEKMCQCADCKEFREE